MRDPFGIDPRLWLLGGLASLAVPPAVVGVTALGVPLPVSGLGVSAVAALAVWRTWAKVPDDFAAPLRGRPWWLALWLLLALAAGVQTVRLSVFMHDSARADLSVLPERAFFRSHACLSAYTEASRLALEGGNVYEPKAYENRKLGRLDVDLFQYPPAFLVMGGVLRLGSEDFTVNRAVWFLVQALGLLAAALALALWVGGPVGARLAWAIPAVWLATPTLLAMQLGNFQLSAFAWSIGSMLLAQGAWPIAAGALLGFTSAGKIFPAVLGLYLLARGRYRPVVWTAVWALAWLLLAIAWFGMRPQWDFLQFQVPRINSGAAFPWIDDADAAGINYSIYGLILRLRALGLPGMTREFGNGLASAYGACVLATAAWLGWRRRAVLIEDDSARAQEAALWLALMNLGSFRSPFVPDAYGMFGTIWLLTLAWAASRRAGLVAGVAAGGLLIALSRVYDGVLAQGQATPLWMLLATLAIQLSALSLNLWMVRRSLPAQRPGVQPLRHEVAAQAGA